MCCSRCTMLESCAEGGCGRESRALPQRRRQQRSCCSAVVVVVAAATAAAAAAAAASKYHSTNISAPTMALLRAGCPSRGIEHDRVGKVVAGGL